MNTLTIRTAALRKKQISRFRKAQATIPQELHISATDSRMVTVPQKAKKAWEAYAWLVAGLGRRLRTRVRYPWIARPTNARVKRGNPRRNPTALT